MCQLALVVSSLSKNSSVAQTLWIKNLETLLRREVLDIKIVCITAFNTERYFTEFQRPADIRDPTLQIAALPYFPAEEDSRIRAIVTYKSRLNDPRYPFCGSAHFVVHLQDESSEARAYAQGLVAEETYDRFEEGRTYYISGLCTGKCPYDFFFNLPNANSLELKRHTMIEEVCPFIAIEIYSYPIRD